jgi:hypothetical protein
MELARKRAEDSRREFIIIVLKQWGKGGELLIV